MSFLQGRAAVITGGASGLGLELARLAADAGMRLALVDVQADALARAADEFAGRGADVATYRVDVAEAAQMDALGAAVQQRFGAPALVFNNAGVGSGGLVWENTASDWAWVFGVNVMGVAHGVRVFTPMMLAAAQADPAWRGHVVNTASMAGLLNAPNMGVYNASKHAVVSISETLHQDLALVTGQVHAHVLCPYFVPTGIAQSHRNRPAEAAERARAPTASQRVSQAMTEKATGSGKVSAAEVAGFVMAALHERRFYIFSHPHALKPVQVRMDDILALRNPTDAFADKPELGERLRAQLRASD